MKLDVPKNTWLADANADYFKEGYWHGVYGIQLVFTGQSCPGPEFLADVMQILVKTRLPKRRIVRLSGLFNPADRDLEVFVKMLKDYGFIVQVVMKSVVPLSWFNVIDWVIYRTGDKLVPIAFDELHYCPPETEEIPEPILPDMRTKPAHFLYLNKGYSVAATTKFICSSERNWMVL